MLIKRKPHSVPQLNTTSTADISFMLLIFFLVTTSMDADHGLVRMLPPADNNKSEQQPPADVSRDNTMSFAITADSRITLNGTPVAAAGLRKRVARFVKARLAEHVIYVDADPNASYDAYFRLEDEIVAAYNSVRNDIALQRFHKEFARCSEQQKNAVRDICPQHIAETYDTGVKGGAQ